MHRFTDFRPPGLREPPEPEPSLIAIIAGYYSDRGLDDPQQAAEHYITAWLELEQAGAAGRWAEVRAVLRQLDALATVWGDEGVFRRCRDRLRQLLQQPQQP